jgi:hypothetical protein
VYHHYGRLDTQTLLHDGLEVGHLVQELDCQWVLVVARAHARLLFPDLRHDLGVVGEVLEAEDQAAAHGVLGGKEEGEDNHRHLVVAEFTPALV